MGKEPGSAENAHRALRAQDNLKTIFARKDKRKLSKDLTFQHNGTLYMVETKTPSRLKHATVEVLWRDKSEVEVRYKGIKLNCKKWAEVIETKATKWINKKPRKPRKNHPWRD